MHTVSTLFQLLSSALVSAAIVAVTGTGFALMYRASRFFHFTHGAVVVAGAYSCFMYERCCGMSLFLSIPLAALSASLLGCGIDVLVYRRLRRQRASPFVLMLASLGMYIVLQNAVSLACGDSSRALSSRVASEGISVLGARITPNQIVIVCVAAAAILVTCCVLRYGNIGKSIRAIGCDRALGVVRGLDAERVSLCASAIGSALAGTAGALLALDVGMVPTMGMNALMMAVVAVIIGGMRSVLGAAKGALLLGLAQQFGVWKIGSEWQDAIAFGVLLVFLLWRPEGFEDNKVPAVAL